MKTFLTIFITALMIVPELLCGNLGMSPGLPLYTAIYFAGAFGLFYGLTAAGFAGLLLDLRYARPYRWTALIWALITFAAFECSMRLRMRSPEAPIVAGITAGFLQLLWSVFYTLVTAHPLPGPDIFSMLVFDLTGGGIFMLLTVLLFDAINFRCNLPRFSPPENTNQHRGGQI